MHMAVDQNTCAIVHLCYVSNIASRIPFSREKCLSVFGDNIFC